MTTDASSIAPIGFERLDSGRWRAESGVVRTPSATELHGETFAIIRPSDLTPADRLVSASWTGS